nr:glycoside hydrolase family 130 protein [Flavihumibacter rivuli]
MIMAGLTAHAQVPVKAPVNVFTKHQVNPIMRADAGPVFWCPVKKDSVHWQKADVFNPAAIIKDNKVYLLFRAEDNPAAHLGGRTSRIGLAVSEDGVHFKSFPEPVLFPDTSNGYKWDYPGGCEDPRVAATEDGQYIMTYTSWDQQVARLTVAISADLRNWAKTGPAFAKAYGGKFLHQWSKSGSPLTIMKNGQQVLARINGKYWMYWGEHFVNLAWSENLADWYPLLDEKGELLRIAETRKGYFDSELTECGPPALITDKGIYLYINGKNAENDNASKSLPKGMYAVGLMVFDPGDPKKLLYRSDQPLLQPSLPHEITGQYKAGTTFAEGLVYFKGKWHLYYGTADSFVGLAICE